jgi:5-formyltetrahydrofolate cyclo-ligase
MTTKTHLRQRAVSQRAALSAVDILQKSTAIAEHVMALAPFRLSQTLMVYLALAQEVQTWRLIEEARQQRKRVAVPVVQGSTLVAVELPTDAARLQRGAYGILEPRCPRTVVHPEDIDCVLVPGLAFDRQGGRVGFGRGYYDRFLYQLPATTCYCGLAFSLQIVSYVPRMPYDVCMHYVVTEEESIACPSASTAP